VRLERIKDEYPDRVELEWRSFLLRPQPEERSLEKFRRYTESWRVPGGQPDGARFRPWSGDEPPPSHSVPPNVAVKAAARQGAFDRYHLAVMDEYFWNNRNVTDAQVLTGVAAACGLDVSVSPPTSATRSSSARSYATITKRSSVAYRRADRRRRRRMADSRSAGHDVLPPHDRPAARDDGGREK
jgi:predicted DsbA family dithiol-disulfide isomerase